MGIALLLALAVGQAKLPAYNIDKEILVQNFKKDPSYQNAYAAHKATGRPLLVLVGAKWCRHCPAAKQLADGVQWDRSSVLYCYLDYDTDVALSKKILGSVLSVPTFVLFRPGARTVCGPVSTRAELVGFVLRKTDERVIRHTEGK